MHELKHLAKVRVAGSNPVFRFIAAGQSWFFKPARSPSRHHSRRVRAYKADLGLEPLGAAASGAVNQLPA